MMGLDMELPTYNKRIIMEATYLLLSAVVKFNEHLCAVLKTLSNNNSGKCSEDYEFSSLLEKGYIFI